MFGQFGHFTVYAPEKVPYAVERYTKEVKRLLGVLEARLAAVGGGPYIMGQDYTIAGLCWKGTMLSLKLAQPSPCNSFSERLTQ